MDPQVEAEAPEPLPLSDDEVVQRVLAGDTALFEILMRRHNERIYRVTRSLLGRDTDVEDVMQEAYVRAFTHLQQFAGRSSFATWLTKIAVHEALAQRRKQQRLVALEPVDAKAPRAPEPAAAQPTPEDIADGRELHAILQRTLDTLSADHRVVFVLREIEELTTTETAECLGITPENVKVRLHRARTQLRRHLEQKIGAAVSQLYPFYRPRCDRVVHGVLERLARPSPVSPPLFPNPTQNGESHASHSSSLEAREPPGSDASRPPRPRPESDVPGRRRD